MKPRPSFPARLPPASPRIAEPRRIAGSALSHAPQAGSRPAAASSAVARSAPVAGASAPVQSYEAIRRDMVSRLSRGGITDPAVLLAMGSMERHLFIDSALRGQAYTDTSLPIGLGQTISKPSVVARMIELLRNGAPGKLGRVLEIGTGCGYQAAVLSLVASEVYSLERLRGLHERARENLRTLRLPNVHLMLGDGMLGYPKGAPYAGIIAAAGGNAVPQAWTDQLAVGGRLVAPVAGQGSSQAQQAIVVIDRSNRGLQQTVYESVHFVPLKSGLA